MKTTGNRFYAAGRYGVMDATSWCAVWCALVSCELWNPARKLVGAYGDACKHGVVFA